MNTLARTDTSVVGRWWWTVDRWSLAAVVAIAGLGALLTLAAAPPMAERMGLDTYYFVKRQFTFLPLAMMVMIATALLSPRGLRRLAVAVLAVSLVLMALVPVVGHEMNGAVRWLRVWGMSLQPSEFVKPGLAVAVAWLFAQTRLDERFPGRSLAVGLFLVTAILLLAQPDVGMTLVVGAVWGIQFFIAGLPIAWVAILTGLSLCGAVGAYLAFDHVRVRVDTFLDPNAGENYQVTQALEAFRNGGLLGRGPGEGRVKELLPDAHADFILAVAGEEFGLVVCLALVALFAFVMLRGLARVLRQDDLFVLLAVAGLLAQFGLQAVINMASATNLIPPKGMTLPFVSYGGSSAIALALTIGMVLALTRERPERGAG